MAICDDERDGGGDSCGFYCPQAMSNCLVHWPPWKKKKNWRQLMQPPLPPLLRPICASSYGRSGS
jgi:hypothetical protein